MNWLVDGRKVQSPSGSVTTFAFPIKESVEVGDVFVVVLDSLRAKS